jgi:hypothetical protein
MSTALAGNSPAGGSNGVNILLLPVSYVYTRVADRHSTDVLNKDCYYLVTNCAVAGIVRTYT